MSFIYIRLALLTILINLEFGNGIFNGWYAEPGEYPFAVCFVIGQSTPHCAGMIVTSEKILTTADCLEKQLTDLRVVAGVLDITNKTSDDFQQAKVAKKDIHPKYKDRYPKISLYNIGVAILEVPLMFTETVKPLVIVSSNELKMQEYYYSFSGNKQDCFTFGWGATAYDFTVQTQPRPTNYSMKLKVTNIMPEMYETCSGLSTGSNFDLRTIGVVCAYPIDQSSTVCNGDGGAGLICGGLKHAYAILTEVQRCGEGRPVVYLLLSNYIQIFGLDQNVESASRNLHVNHILLIGLSAYYFSRYSQQPLPLN